MTPPQTRQRSPHVSSTAASRRWARTHSQKGRLSPLLSEGILLTTHIHNPRQIIEYIYPWHSLAMSHLPSAALSFLPGRPIPPRYPPTCTCLSIGMCCACARAGSSGEGETRALCVISDGALIHQILFGLGGRVVVSEEGEGVSHPQHAGGGGCRCCRSLLPPAECVRLREVALLLCSVILNALGERGRERAGESSYLLPEIEALVINIPQEVCNNTHTHIFTPAPPPTVPVHNNNKYPLRCTFIPTHSYA